MKRFQFTSTVLDGAIEFYYNDSGLLEAFDIGCSNLSEKQHQWILDHLPKNVENVNDLVTEGGKTKIMEVKLSVTFEMFWKKYDDRLASSKKKTQQKWNKMSEGERERAYYFISKYFLSLGAGIRKKYAETYLNAELWNN